MDVLVLASFPGSPHKWRKAGWGLGMRLLVPHHLTLVEKLGQRSQYEDNTVIQFCNLPWMLGHASVVQQVCEPWTPKLKEKSQQVNCKLSYCSSNMHKQIIKDRRQLRSGMRLHKLVAGFMLLLPRHTYRWIYEAMKQQNWFVPCAFMGEWVICNSLPCKCISVPTVSN